LLERVNALLEQARSMGGEVIQASMAHDLGLLLDQPNGSIPPNLRASYHETDAGARAKC
jgi:hypothetical protein